MATLLHWTLPNSTAGATVTRSSVTRVSVPSPSWEPFLLGKWAGYCEGFFQDLGRISPKELATMIAKGSLSTANLSFAAESMGLATDHGFVIGTLVPLLVHDSAVVREGAIYGLAKHLTGDLEQRLRNMAQADASWGVRQAAQEALQQG